jgi:microcystin-dependent protein
MTDTPYLTMMQPWACNFAPVSWAMCTGQLLSINAYQALYSLVGTLYGGDGRTSFGLPDLRGRIPVGMNQGPGLSHHPQGTGFGQDTETLNVLHLPTHTHTAELADGQFHNGTIACQGGAGNQSSPTDHYHAASVTPQGSRSPIDMLYSATTNSATKAGSVAGSISGAVQVGISGGNQPFPIDQPSTALNWCICTEGIYPSRN